MATCFKVFLYALLSLVVFMGTTVLAESPSDYSFSSITYNADSTYSGRVNRLINTDQTKAKAKSRLSRSYPPSAYMPDCSFEIMLKTRSKESLDGMSLYGVADLSVPTVAKARVWTCHYRTTELRNEDGSKKQLEDGYHEINTFLYCPNSSLETAGSAGATNNATGLCPIINKAIAKEGGSAINLQFVLNNLPATALNAPLSNKNALQIGPVQLSQIAKRSKSSTPSNKYTTDTLVKTTVLLIGGHAAQTLAGGNTFDPQDKCAADWAPLEIVGRCCGLVTHSEYPKFKNIPIVRDAKHCKSLCCELGNKCVTWQYWTDIQLCKLGDSVRIGTEGANTPLWCDSERPIVWQGQKLPRLPDGKMKPGTTPVTVSTQCFGLGDQQKKNLPPDASGVAKSVPLNVNECRDLCLAKKDCAVWQAHEKRGCYIGDDMNVFCEPYKGPYTGGRRKCNDKCPKS